MPATLEKFEIRTTAETSTLGRMLEGMGIVPNGQEGVYILRGKPGQVRVYNLPKPIELGTEKSLGYKSCVQAEVPTRVIQELQYIMVLNRIGFGTMNGHEG